MSQPVLDPAMIEQLRQMSLGDNSILKDLLELFQSDANPILEKLEEGIARGQGQAVREAAHALKGGSANLGATRLAELCLQLETQGRENRLEGADAILRDVRDEYLRVLDALQAEIDAG